MGNRGTSDSGDTDMDRNSKKRRHSNDFGSPDMSGDPASIFSSCSILHYWLWQEEEEEVEERLRQTERLKEVNAATIRFFLEFDWLFKEENPLITGHLTGIADELDKVIMKATMAKWSIFSFCVPECDRYLKRLQTVKKEILSMRRLDTCRLFGFFHREEEEKLREAIEETIRFFKECDGWFKEENPLIAGHLAGMKVIMKAIMAKQRLFRIRVGTLDNYTFKKRLHSEVALQEWKYPNSNEHGAQRGSTNRPKLLRHVSREDFSIPSFVQLRRQAYLSRSTPHSHALGGADTGEALLPPVLVSTLKDALADLSLVGGGSLDETIRRILQAVLKDEVASELYWAGHGSKQSFQQANLQEVIFRASGNRYSGEAAFADVGPHQHQLQLQHQQCMLVKAF